jgi:hypothetical protein
MKFRFEEGPTLDDLDPVSKALLPVLRHFLSCLQGDVPGAWQQGFLDAVETWGEARGLAIAHRGQAFLAALLRSRKGRLAYCEPCCTGPHHAVSDDELSLLALLRHLREDQPGLARNKMAALTRGRIDAEVVRSGLAFAALLDGPNGHWRARGAPKLAVVKA